MRVQDLCPSQYSAAPASALAPSANASAAPKLTPTAVQALRQKFQASYPGELLTPDVMPAPELLSAL